jgi:hypothetical protein
MDFVFKITARVPSASSSAASRLTTTMLRRGRCCPNLHPWPPMNLRIALTLAALPIASLCTTASAQCEDAAASAKTAASMKSELSRIQTAQQAAFGDAFAALDARGADLGWTSERKAAFLSDVQRSPAYAMLEAQKQVQTFTVMSIQQDLKKPEIREDPVKACQAGIGFLEPMRKIDALTTQEVQLLRERIAAAK